MKLQVLFCQRKEKDNEKIAPEALAVIDSYKYADKEESVVTARMDEIRSSLLEGGQYENAKWITVDLGDVEMSIRDALLDKAVPIKADVLIPKDATSGRDIRKDSITVQVGRQPGTIQDSEIF